MINFDRHPGHHQHRWFDESLCELASLFVLHRLAASWTAEPPPNVTGAAAFAPHHRAYAEYLADKYPRPRQHDIPRWLTDNVVTLQSNRHARALTSTLAVILLDRFLADPSLWRECGHLNGWDPPHRSDVHGLPPLLGRAAARVRPQQEVARRNRRPVQAQPAVAPADRTPPGAEVRVGRTSARVMPKSFPGWLEKPGKTTRRTRSRSSRPRRLDLTVLTYQAPRLDSMPTTRSVVPPFHTRGALGTERPIFHTQPATARQPRRHRPRESQRSSLPRARCRQTTARWRPTTARTRLCPRRPRAWPTRQCVPAGRCRRRSADTPRWLPETRQVPGSRAFANLASERPLPPTTSRASSLVSSDVM